MQHIREHEFADVLGMVSEMRSHRLSMVQTEVSSSPLPRPPRCPSHQCSTTKLVMSSAAGGHQGRPVLRSHSSCLCRSSTCSSISASS